MFSGEQQAGTNLIHKMLKLHPEIKFSIKRKSKKAYKVLHFWDKYYKR